MNTKSIAEMRADLEKQAKRLEAFENILERVDRLIHENMVMVEETPYHREEYIDEETGETKTRTVWATYKTDEDGNYIYEPPTEDDYRHPDYVALLAARDEIMGLLQ